VESVKSDAFNPRVVAAMIAAGIAAFAAFIFLFAYADDFRSGHDGRAHAFSVSAVGYKGLVRLVELQHGTARMVRAARDMPEDALLVVTAEERSRPQAIAEIAAAHSEAPTLIVLPKYLAVRKVDHPGWVQGLTVISEDELAALVKPFGTFEIARARVRGTGPTRGRSLLDGYEGVSPPTIQSISGPELRPLLLGPAGRILLAQIGDKPLYILAEPDLLNNRGLKNPAAARAALELLDRLSPEDAEEIAFDLSLNGFGRKPGLIRLAFEPPFLALTLAIFVAALLAGLHGAFRFGPAEGEIRAVAFGKAALVENSAGLFRLARREHRAGETYAELIREAAAHESGAGLQGEALDHYLDRLSPPDRPFSALAARLRDAGDPNALLAAARDLFSWKKDLIK
jgi:hypothetical protein